MRRVRGALLVLCGTLLAIAMGVVTAAPASAHPLGNFTVNRYARLEVSAGVVRVYYVLDEAEIPAFQERDAITAGPDRFADRRAVQMLAGLSLTIDGVPASLTVEARELTQPQGQGGLHTLRLAVLYRAPLLAGDVAHQVAFIDANEPDRIGWREIVVSARGDGRLLASDAPSHDRSDELRRYPADLVRSPLDLRQASFRFTPGTHSVPALPFARPPTAPTRAGGRFASLITRGHLTPWVLAGMLGVALLVGAGHALAPGHGKTVMAAYLVGTRGRLRDAVSLGVIVSLMHTGSVLALGLVLFHVSRATSIDRLYPTLTLVGGLLVLGVGAWLLRSRLRVLRHWRGGHAHEHGQGHHHHHPGHDHGLPPEVRPLSRRGLVVLAGAGGIVPSPSAVVVLISAFAVGRIALGLALIGAFSVGLASTLTGVGLVLVLGRRVIEQRGEVWLRRLPVAGASTLVLVGGVVAVQGLRTIH